MKSRPILFSGPMVRALLAGTKTQTRRIMKPQPAEFVQVTPDRHPTTRTAPYIDAYCGEKKTAKNPRGMSREWHWWTADNRTGARVARCPYGVPGDQLWGRESIYLYAKHEEIDGWSATSRYRADNADTLADAWPWKNEVLPSIHCPRGLSRITLEIINVRAERLNDISEDDARAEGLSAITKDGNLFKYGIPDQDGLPGTDNDGWPWDQWERDPRKAYKTLFEKINGPGAWDENPWVWAIEFKRVTP